MYFILSSSDPELLADYIKHDYPDFGEGVTSLPLSVALPPFCLLDFDLNRITFSILSMFIFYLSI